MILLDTGPLVALCDQRDGLHRSALKVLRAVLGTPLATCEAVLAEAYFHLGPSARRRLRTLLRDLRIEILPSARDSALWLEALEWLHKYEEHEPDWADGCLVVLSARLPKAQLWTYDGEFSNVWRRPDGTKIPLVALSASARR